MRYLLLTTITVLVLLAGCSSTPEDVCASACKKLHDCGVRQIRLTTINTYTFGDDCSAVSCDKTTECVAGCVMKAGCGDYDPVVRNGPFHSCLVACNSFFRIPDGG